MKKPKSQREALECIAKLEPYRVGNVFAETLKAIHETIYGYAVYSYGKHWIMTYYSYDNNTYYINMDKVSVSTSKQTSLIRNNLFKYIEHAEIVLATQAEIDAILHKDWERCFNENTRGN